MDSGITYHICAVDGGGTGCRAAIALPDGTIVSRGSGGPANYTTNPVQAAENVLAAVRQAADCLGHDAPALETLVTHLGLAGIMSEADACALKQALPFAACTVSDDRMTSALGAMGDRDGVLLAIGTGSFAVVRKGVDFRFLGGWGFNAGDQASGAWLGRAVLEHTLLACDGLVAESALTLSVIGRFDGMPGRAATFAGQASPVDFAGFAPLVIAAAKDGDDVGQMLMSRGATYLNLVLKAANVPDDAPICLTGGVGPHFEPYLAPEFRRRVRPPAGVALDGALRLARTKLQELEILA